MPSAIQMLGALFESRAEAREGGGPSSAVPEPSPPLSPEERQAMVNALSQRVKKFYDIVKSMEKKHIDRWGTELEFRAKDYREFLEFFEHGFEMDYDGHVSLANDINTTFEKIAGSGTVVHPPFYYCRTKRYFKSMSGNTEHIMGVLEMYSEAVSWLNQYKEFECEDWWLLWRGECPKNDEINLRDGCIVLGGGCFPGDSFLQMRDGGLITFDRMIELSENGETLPEIASFDDATGAVIYQQPTKVIDHRGLHSSLLYLDVQQLEGETISGEGVTLKVTDNHRMLVEREGEVEWVKAAELQAGDLLVGPENERYFYDGESRRVEEGAHDVFNLTFSSDKTGMVPTYLVSPDGDNWFVAHNIKL